ncbi:hypothetical protein QJS66_19850 [Kocuria rhizophila]|nr:hypothetical protein QJS66_19850 [Kocuria rhizophila]
MNGTAIVMMVVAMVLVWADCVGLSTSSALPAGGRDRHARQDEGELAEAHHGGIDDAHRGGRARRPRTRATCAVNRAPAGEGAQAPKQATGPPPLT